MEYLKDKLVIALGALICLAAAFWLAGGVATKAKAADKGGMEDVFAPAKASTWTGCYVGGSAGLATTSTEIGIGPFSLDGVASHGGKVAGVLGCDMKLSTSPVVLGVFGEYGTANNEFTVNPGLFSAKFGNYYGVGARVGYSLNGAMPYLLAAWMHSDVTWSAGSSILPSSFAGYAYGLGIEIPVSRNLSWGVEGRSTHFQAENVGPVSIQPTELSVMATLRLRFNQ